MDFKKDDVVVVKPGVFDAGQELTVLGEPVFKEQWWVPVADPREEDPTFFKAQYLDLKTKRNYFLIKKESRNAVNSYILATTLDEAKLDLDYLGMKLTEYDGAGASNGWEISATRINPDVKSLQNKALIIAGDNVFKV